MGRIITSSKSVTGLREVNQDRHAHFRMRDVEILLVCDGNGGEGAEKLSGLVTSLGIGLISYALLKNRAPSFAFLKELGLSTIERCASQAKLMKAGNEWGTTMTLVLIHRCKLMAFWVGDSPASIYKAGKLERLTEPLHTLKEELIDLGESRELISMQKGLSSILTRCIGHSADKPEFREIDILPPYVVLVASDGIGALPEEELAKIVARTGLMRELPEKIIDASLKHGSDDNITVISALALSGCNGRA